MEGELIKLQMRRSNGQNFDVEVKKDATVLDLKKACAELCEYPVDDQRLIFKGKVLKDDQTLVEYKIESGMTVHLVKGAKPPGAQPSAEGISGV
jgi:ubiquilin